MNQFERARDLRQLRFMLSTLHSYAVGSSDLARLVEDLDELLMMLSDENPAWRAQFKAEWAALERGVKDGDAAPKKATRQAVPRLTKLVQAEIARRERGQNDA